MTTPSGRRPQTPMLTKIGRAAAAVTAALLAIVGLIGHPAAVITGWLVAGVLIGPLIAVGLHAARPSRHGLARTCAAAGAASISTVAVVAGLIAVVGVPAGLLLTATAAAGVALLSRWRRGGSTPAPSVLDAGGDLPDGPGPCPGTALLPAGAVDDVHLSTTAQLCGVWQRSYWLLCEHPPCGVQAETVRLRAAVLDELERRDPEGLSRWLRDGPRAGSDPGRFLIRGP